MTPSEELEQLMVRVKSGEVEPPRAVAIVAESMVRMYNVGFADGARAQRSDQDEPTGVSSSFAGDPRSPEDGTPEGFLRRPFGVQGGATASCIVHVLVSYPKDMRTRCGLTPHQGFPAVTKAHAMQEQVWRAGAGLAICVRCALFPFTFDGETEVSL